MLDFELFRKCLQSMQESNDLILQYCDVVNPEFLDQIAVSWSFLELLEKSMNDQNHWISYWAYERDFGRDWDEHTASEADGTPILLQTPRQLYEYLIAEDSNRPHQGWSNSDYDAVAKAYSDVAAAHVGACHEN